MAESLCKKSTVIKLGGSVYTSRDTAITDLVELQKTGQPLIVVHGGASLVTEWLKRVNHTTAFFEGERVTDETSLEVVTAVLGGLVNKEVVASIIKAGGNAIGISGVDGALIQGKIKERTRGYTGEAVKINPEPLEAILRGGFIPVVSPVSLHAFDCLEGERALLNINGDGVAGAIAAALCVKKLIFMTDVDGLKDGRGNLLGIVTPAEAVNLIQSGVAHGGMIPKLRACIEAAGNMATVCSIINGSVAHSLKNEITRGYTGTTILPQKGE